MTASQEARSVANQNGEPGDSRKWWEKKRFAFPIIGFVVVAGLASLGDSSEPDSESPQPAASSAEVEEQSEEIEGQRSIEDEPPTRGTAEENPDPAPVAEQPEPVPPTEPSPSDVPEVQAQFVSTFQSAVTQYNEAASELQAANALNERDSQLCALTNQGQVDNWVGIVESVGANGDGKGVLSVEVAPDLLFKTWNNAFSDIGDGTLIEPSSALFEKVLPLTGGERVTFSGRFVGGSNHCLKDSRLTDYGRATDPAFIFKFRDIEVIG